MDMNQVADVLRDGVVVVLKLASPMLLLSMMVGVAVAIFQAVTQIHEQTIAFILKLSVVVTMLLLTGGWMMENLLDYAHHLFTLMRG